MKCSQIGGVANGPLARLGPEKHFREKLFGRGHTLDLGWGFKGEAII